MRASVIIFCYYSNTYAPIFIDNAESVNGQTIKTNSQQVRLDT